MLKKRGLLYNVIPVNINKGKQLMSDHEAINPGGRLPEPADKILPLASTP